ncbi:protein-glutamine gamma-glutamyltransferase E-like [Kryptolebias marmoratus]|uniref:protein-glutamine gamma-glutamyltransferase n=1 Tax=Kryptolebias marmoratus TaxID=37003 RepID=A0A3Q3AVT1_KRYMA|nr:protein-glutamine gamma-glutamyltransferase E-like [Kryptolebias marmoratus]
MTNYNNNGVFKEVDLHSETNNKEHRTSDISFSQLIVRRGQSFNLTLKLGRPFNPDQDQLTMTALTGSYPSEDQGTMSLFGVPDKVIRSASAKAVWKAELQKSSSPETGVLALTITPPPDTPIGNYKLSAKLKEEEKVLAELSVLFNPWCPDDWVFLPDDNERQEYVMNERGIVYRGANTRISPMDWDFGQFEEDMLKMSLKILDLSIKHKRDPADDVSARCNPIYVSRVITNMIHSSDNPFGVLQGNWSGNFGGGVPPTSWSSSYIILKQWYDSFYRTVKYGQCWVFASVMCSVMRVFGVPCRVVTNFESAHDTDKNLIIDTYYNNDGGMTHNDSIWNFHVWVECWMKRPDLAEDGRYDGWQVLDPTPQEKSDGMFCCGPAPVSAILNGDILVKYDVPFVFAEVNADCITWLILSNNDKIKVSTNTKNVGQCISTKAVGSLTRMDLTDTYKYKEGSAKERAVFAKAFAMLNNDTMLNNDAMLNNKFSLMRACACPMATVTLCETEPAITINAIEETETIILPEIVTRFEEVSEPMNGEDVKLKLILSSNSSVPRLLSINISVQALEYTGTPAGNIQTEVMEEKLLHGEDLSIPIQVPLEKYHKYLTESKSINVSAMITDQEDDKKAFLAERVVVLQDPTISITVPDEVQLNQDTAIEVAFSNPLDQILRDCKLTVSGSGLVSGQTITKLPDVMLKEDVHVTLNIVPYKSGTRTLLVNFDSDFFRDIKASAVVNVKT